MDFILLDKFILYQDFECQHKGWTGEERLGVYVYAGRRGTRSSKGNGREGGEGQVQVTVMGHVVGLYQGGQPATEVGMGVQRTDGIRWLTLCDTHSLTTNYV